MDVSTMVVVTVLAVLYLTFLLWYGGRGKPLTPDEVEDLLRQMRRQAGRDDSTGQAEPAMLRHFRDLADSDDGREFWMVNLQAFRERAQYPPDLAVEYGDDPMAANSRYNRAIIPQLLRRGSHPVFATVVAGQFINDGDGPVWHQVAAVRYRSRRDLLRMAVGIAGSGIDIHKWAALERTQVFPVRPYLSLTLVRTSVAAVFLIAGVMVAMMIG